ncbi:MAG: PLP-dependent aminotransferase family protein [Anaerolineales bacterium]|nr:PLP-dependent aminotransferase family protein [Anaerolineales bacterium]
MPIQLLRQTDQPLYLQVAEQLRQQIENGELAPHTRLPASRILAKKLGVNRITIVNAYAELEAEGLVISRVGSGTFVAGEQQPAALAPSPLWRGSPVGRRPWNANQMVAEMMRLARQPGVISFAGGSPSSEFLPVHELRRALNEVLRRDGVAALQYEEAAGYLPLRETIARQMQQQHIPVNGQDILITTGCQQALDVTVNVLTRSSEDNLVVVEDPCYLGFLDILAARRLTPLGVPVDGQGMQVDRLEQIILRHRPRLIYTTPSFHNPTGTTLSLPRRRALLEVASRYGVPILEDSCYDTLYYEGEPPPSLKSLDTADIVFLAGGFGKTLAPGLRIGYLVAPSAWQERVIAAKQTADILTSPLNQYALHSYLHSGHYADHLSLTRRAYRERRDLMAAAARRYFPQEAVWRCPAGGMYLWVEMPPSGPTATDLYMAAINYSVVFALGSVFSASNSFSHAMRLNFATPALDEIEEGMRRLGKAWKELLARNIRVQPVNQRCTMPIL